MTFYLALGGATAAMLIGAWMWLERASRPEAIRALPLETVLERLAARSMEDSSVQARLDRVAVLSQEIRALTRLGTPHLAEPQRRERTKIIESLLWTIDPYYAAQAKVGAHTTTGETA